MKQVKLIQEDSLKGLEEALNNEYKRLSSIYGINILETKFIQSGASFSALIEYEQIEKKILFEQDIIDTDKIVKLEEK